MMGCDGACAAGFDLVFIGLPLLSLLAIAVVAPVLLWLSAWYAPVLLWLSALVCVD